MGLSLSLPIQSSMLVYCSCSPLLLLRTLDPRPSSVPSSQPWKPTMILIMVIIYIIAILYIMHIIISICYYYNYACYCNYAHFCMFCCIGWLESVASRVVYELDYKKPILYVIPIQSILCKLPVVPVGALAPSRTTCATHFLALPATAGWVLAMNARCGSSTRGLWDGRGICNES